MKYFIKFGNDSSNLTMCVSRKYPYPPQGRSLEISRGSRVSTAKIYKGKYEAQLQIPGGGRFQMRKPSLTEVWISSGTTQCCHEESKTLFTIIEFTKLTFLLKYFGQGLEEYFLDVEFDLNAVWDLGKRKMF